MAQQTLLGGDGTTGENGATHNSKANSNFTELYAASAAAQADADAANTAISDHVSDGTAAHAASAIAFTGVGTISATNVQDAIAEVAAEAGSVSVPDASPTVKGIIEILVQSEMNTGTDTTRAATASLIKNRDGDVTALTDGATVDITSDKNTLSTSSATRTFTIGFTGDQIIMVVTLSATTSTYTFPAAALCVYNGFSSGDNTCVLSGVSGDKHVFAISKVGSAYYVVGKNFGQ